MNKIKKKYNHTNIEKKWQSIWRITQPFRPQDSLNTLNKYRKYYILDMFPYPSAYGLHVGHTRGYTATDVLSRIKVMQGYKVLHSIGWDSFGLPAERAAQRQNTHPNILTRKNIKFFKYQISKLGYDYDWGREICTSDKNYYRWTQWIFIKLYKQGLAYKKKSAVNWCPKLNTVLANEEVKDNTYIETGDYVSLKYVSQWVLRITRYANRLILDLDGLEWPRYIKNMQYNWIGKKRGLLLHFKLYNYNSILKIFSQKTESLFAFTYIVVLPEHNFSNILIFKRLYIYIDSLLKKRMHNNAQTSFYGFNILKYVKHPISNMRISIWVGSKDLKEKDWILPALPSIKIANNNFAVDKSIPRIYIYYIHTGKKNVYSSDFLNKLSDDVARSKVSRYFIHMNIAKTSTQFLLKDWLFSRQRYWGEPFPVRYMGKSLLTSNRKDLPVSLPYMDIKHTYNSENLYKKMCNQWSKITVTNMLARREFLTMPQWAGSCWYYLRYLDSSNNNSPWRLSLERYWMPIDLYVGGAEHAVLHLMYARFWHKVLYDSNIVHTKEPFKELFSQGTILSKSYSDKFGKYYYLSEIAKKNNDNYYSKLSNDKIVVKIEKMSKSKFNVYDPQTFISKYGADAFRMYMLFVGPLEQSIVWHNNGIIGIYKFLLKLWDFTTSYEGGNKITMNTKILHEYEKINKKTNKIIYFLNKNIENKKLNVTIALFMELFNYLNKFDNIPNMVIIKFVKLLYPYAPHMASEIWERLKYTSSPVEYGWVNAANTSQILIPIVIQLNGKMKKVIDIRADYKEVDLINVIILNKDILYLLKNKKIKKIIHIKNKIFNILV